MPKVIMTCGRICTGKSTYAEQLRGEMNAVLLSVDEMTLALFGQDTGDMHDTYVERAERYLYDKSVQIVRSGIDVILDWGFWTAEERRYAREFYASRGITCELHYINVPDGEWRRRIDKRNADITAGKCKAYFVDEGLARKFAAIFEPPGEDETDVQIN